MVALVEEKKPGRGVWGEEVEDRKDLCSAILCGHPNLLENFFSFAAARQAHQAPSKALESLKCRELLRQGRRLAGEFDENFHFGTETSTAVLQRKGTQETNTENEDQGRWKVK